MPVVLGGIEASLRRLTHYDYWKDELKPCILCEAKADVIIYGMGEKTILQLAGRLAGGQRIKDIRDIPQMVYLAKKDEIVD